jgi:hypothetical protein
MALMKVELRPRIAPDPKSANVTPEMANEDLLAMLRWLALPKTSGSSEPWPGNYADLDVEYDVETGLHVRADLLTKVQHWLGQYTAHYNLIRQEHLSLVLEPVPESRGIYYYFDTKEFWCSVHLSIYVAEAAAGKEWTLVGAHGSKAKVQIGLRYPMPLPWPEVETLRPR